ncbi:hypothetical protein M0812_05091 [Anaeramoeba flamelloides]|uniref:Uncharacterized protein n=1 Tax=Anaeramoeba flamelloides TaxID=1746091 RepID=A0AAV8A9T2_9EUKA|nr:hypothetical protein M0812_05091 [Anaeramoeba flamelloides]
MKQNLIKLKNENKTAWNITDSVAKKIVGKKIYLNGKHEIKIKIYQFQNSQNKRNKIILGVIKIEKRENFINNYDWEGILDAVDDCWEGTYFFEVNWNKKIFEHQKRKKEYGKWTKEKYPEEIKLKKK